MRQLIKNGRLILPDRQITGDLLMEDGRIAAIDEKLPDGGCEAHDATGCLVFPGFIDPHTHLEMDAAETRTADDFPSGTAAALAGGTTCVLDFATQDRGMTLMEALEAWRSKAGGRSSCDYGFHMAVTDWTRATADELSNMAAVGVTSFKLYLAYDNLRVRDAAVYEVLRAVGKLGGVVGVHCENGDLINELMAECRAKGERAPIYHPLCRPGAVEAEAVGRLLTIAELAQTPVVVAHLSSERGLEAVRAARARGQKVYVESCPQYLLLDETLYGLPDFEGAKYVCSPPLRAEGDRAALWEALTGGEIDTLGSDHCSFNFKGQKDLGREDFSRIPNGLPGVEHRAVLLYTAGVAPGRVGPGAMARMLSEQPARLYGMYPQKGALAVGSDADVVVWDPEPRGVIRADGQLQRVDYTPYEGIRTVGGARQVFLRGQLVAADGRVLVTGAGRYVKRGPSEFYRDGA